MFAVCLAAALVHFAGWMQSHSSTVTGIMYGSLLASAACFLVWLSTNRRTAPSSASGSVPNEQKNVAQSTSSSGNINFAPVIQVGSVGAPALSPEPPPSLPPKTENNVRSELPDLELTFAQGRAHLEGEVLRFSEQGSYCISFRVFNKPATLASDAMVAKNIVASVRLNLGSKVGSVESSCWMDYDANQIDLRPGAHAHALLAFPEWDALTMYENPNVFERSDLEWDAPFNEPERVPFPINRPAIIVGEINIISRADHKWHTTLAHKKFVIEFGDGVPGQWPINVKWA